MYTPKQIFSLTSILLLLLSFPAAGQQTELTASEKQAITSSLAARLVRSYVFEDKAQQMSNALTSINFPSDRKAFAKAVDDTIRAISGDAHLRFMLNQQEYDALMDTITQETAATNDDFSEASTNYGFERVEILTGNIGYLKITQFYESEAAFKAAAAAMAFLSNVDAYIIDLSGNGGGSGKMGQFLASYFFEEGDQKLLLTNYNREANELVQEWSLFTFNGTRVPDKPLYIIVNGGTGSAAEAFPYAMQAYKRAVVVGKKTWGGAHSGTMEPIAHGFVAFIPSGRVLSPVTNSNWEQVGVIPDIEIASDLAVYKIQELLFAQWKQRPGISEERKNYLDWYERYCKMQLNHEPVRIPPGLKGSYGGVPIKVENNRLILGKGIEFVPYSETVFFAVKGYNNSYKNDLVVEFDDPKKPKQLNYKVLSHNGSITSIPLNRD